MCVYNISKPRVNGVLLEARVWKKKNWKETKRSLLGRLLVGKNGFKIEV